MKIIENPNVPHGNVMCVAIDGRIDKSIENKLKKIGIKTVKTKRHVLLYDEVAFHADMQFVHLKEDIIIYSPDISKDFLEELRLLGFKLIKGEMKLSDKYPYCAAYNCAIVGKYAFHNTKITDEVLKAWLKKLEIELIHVNQGYTKCSTTIVNEEAIITADIGIANAAKNKLIDVLLIEPENEIKLEGLDYGFIGGATGLIGRNIMAITGDAKKLNAYAQIEIFLKKYEVVLMSLTNDIIVDVGSIIPLLEK